MFQEMGDLQLVPKIKMGDELSHMEARQVEYLFKGYLPRGKIVLLSGEAGVGKTWLLCYLASIVSSGGTWFTGDKNEDGPVGVILVTEDDIPSVILPRLVTMGANLDNITALQRVPPSQAVIGVGMDKQFSLPENLEQLKQAIVYKHAQLCIIDPIMNVLGTGNNQQVYRDVMIPLASIADETECTIVLCNHMGKGKYNPKNTRSAIGGFIALQQGARVSYLVQKDETDVELCVLTTHKCNIGPSPEPFGYKKVKTASGTTLQFFVKGQAQTVKQVSTETIEQRIVAYIQKFGTSLPHVVANDLGLNAGTIRVTMRRMRDNGKLQQEETGKYSIPIDKTMMLHP